MSNSAIIPILFAVLQVTSAAPANSHSNNSTHQFQKRMATGSKIAIGICVPCVALVLGLGLWILWFYPEERRKLRERNARREIELAQKQRQGSEAGTLPVYQQHEGNDDVAMNAPAVPAATAQPSPGYSAQAPTDARHAALAM